MEKYCFVMFRQYISVVKICHEHNKVVRVIKFNFIKNFEKKTSPFD